MAIIFNVTYLYFVKIVNILLFLHTPLYNIHGHAHDTARLVNESSEKWDQNDG
jgi:hypothetical protein